MGLPPTGLYTLCWTHGQTPMFAQNGLSTVGKSEKRILIPMKMDVLTQIIQILLIRYPQRYAVRS